MSTSKSRVERKVMIGQERAPGSRNGNPRFRMIFSDGTTALTTPDASCAYGLTNREYQNVPLDVTFNGRGTVDYFRVVEQ